MPECDEDQEYHYEYDEELYEEEGVMSAHDLDPVTFCYECAPEDGDFLRCPTRPGRERTATTTCTRGRAGPCRRTAGGSRAIRVMQDPPRLEGDPERPFHPSLHRQ